MATIPSYTAKQGLTPDRIPNATVVPYQARALEQLGNSISDVGSALMARQEAKENFAAENAYRKFELDLTNEMEIAKTNMPEGGSGFHEGFMQNTFMPKRDAFLEKVPPRLRDKFSTLLDPTSGADFGAWSNRAASAERDATMAWAKDEVGATQEQLANAISLNPDAYEETLNSGRALIEAAPIPSLEKKVMLREWENMAQVAHLNRMLEDDPEGVLKDLGANPNKLAPTTQFQILADAVAWQETRGNPNQVSPAGAVGEMQVMPGTAKWMAGEGKLIDDPNFPRGADMAQIGDYLMQPGVSRKYGEAYLRYLQKQYPNDMEAQLIAYNGGPGRADKWLKAGRDDSVLPKETRDYYKAIGKRLPGTSQAAAGAPDGVKFSWTRDGGNVALPDAERAKLNPDLLERVGTAFANIGLNEVKIYSGHRSPKRNAAAKGAKHSQHIEGNAIDIDLRGRSREEKLEIIRSLSAAGITGIGVYANNIHADMGNRRAWGPSFSKGDDNYSGVPSWARETIIAHVKGKLAPVGGSTPKTRYGTLPYDKRQQFIAAADSALSKRLTEAKRVDAVTKVQMSEAMNNEVALISATGRGSGGFDDGKVATTLGEDDYLKWIERRGEAQRMFVAKDGMITMSPSEMAERVADYEANPISSDFASDQKIHAAVVKEADRIARLRTNSPDKAAMEFPAVAAAHEKVKAGIASGDPDVGDVTAFVRLMIEHQQAFGVKPEATAPIPKEWAFEIGQSLTRIPQVQGRNVVEVRDAIAVQYQALQAYFGDYTDEVILYALTEYKGLSKPVADMITGAMKSVAVGGDPFKLRDRVTDAAQVESAAEPGMWDSFSSFLFGNEDPDTAPEGSTDAAPPSNELVLRVIGQLNSADTPEEEAALVNQYGKAAVDAAKFRLSQGAQ